DLKAAVVARRAVRHPAALVVMDAPQSREPARPDGQKGVRTPAPADGHPLEVGDGGGGHLDPTRVEPHAKAGRVSHRPQAMGANAATPELKRDLGGGS